MHLKAADGKYYEGAVPLMDATNSFTLPFDGSSISGMPFWTGLAIANADSAPAATVTFTAYRADGG